MHHVNLQKRIADLAQFLRDDNDLLQTFCEQEVLKRVPQKDTLVEDYQSAYLLFKKDPEACRALPQEIKESLIQDVQSLEALSLKNLKLVERVLGAHELYVKTLTRVARETMMPKVEGYSALGRCYKDKRFSGNGPSLPPLSMNQCL